MWAYLIFLLSKKIAKQGGTIAGNTRKEIEQKTGESVVTNLNAKTFLENKKNLEIENKEINEEIKKSDR